MVPLLLPKEISMCRPSTSQGIKPSTLKTALKAINKMPSYLASAFAFVLITVSFSSSATAVSCGVCASSIFFQGQTRTLTVTLQDSGNAVQCDYLNPPISGLAPTCTYRNVDGVLTFTNTGPTLFSLPGACPSTIPLIQKTSC
ncbi:hypothetical protein B0H19DRAFT_1380546 [Mycena capillaripes]|nr:hypothetical protein B0H19DRAFT_1380546 [Mycena capillaripes]